MEKDELIRYLRDSYKVRYPERIAEKILKYEEIHKLSFVQGDLVIIYGSDYCDVIPSIKGYRKSIDMKLLKSLKIMPVFENSIVTYDPAGISVKSTVGGKVIGAVGEIIYNDTFRNVHIFREELKTENDYWETAPTSKLLNACEKECYRAAIPDLLYMDKYQFENDPVLNKTVDIRLEISREFLLNEQFREKHATNKRINEFTAAEIDLLYKEVLKERAKKLEEDNSAVTEKQTE